MRAIPPTAVVVAAALAASLTVAAAPPPQAQPPREGGAASQCPIADDPEYAYTPRKPVQVGGGAMYVAARERRYLDALRAPDGRPISYKRTGSGPQETNSLTILDHYQISYEGLEKPLVIYLDAYHYDDALKAPQGLTCGRPIDLAPPAPDQFLAMDSLVKVAVEQGATQEFAPIPLDPDGTPTRGVALDQFRLIARTARAAAAAGKPIVLDPNARRPDTLRQRTVLLAYPLSCDGRTIAAKSIDLERVTPNGQRAPVPHQGDHVTGAAISEQLPGFEAPASSVMATYPLQSLRPNDTMRIAYAEACGASADVMLPVKFTPARLAASPAPSLPSGAAPTQSPVRLQVLIDLAGSFQDPVYIGGPSHLVDAAMQAVRTTWKAEPARVNGAPVVTPVTLVVRFGAQAPLQH